jgi:hypothetical protein
MLTGRTDHDHPRGATIDLDQPAQPNVTIPPHAQRRPRRPVRRQDRRSMTAFDQPHAVMASESREGEGRAAG